MNPRMVISFHLTSTARLRLDRNVPPLAVDGLLEHADQLPLPDRQSAHRSGPSQGRGGRWSAACTATARRRARTAASAPGRQGAGPHRRTTAISNTAAPATRRRRQQKAPPAPPTASCGFALDDRRRSVGDNFAHGLTDLGESKRIISTALAPIAVAFRTRRRPHGAALLEQLRIFVDLAADDRSHTRP